MECKEHERWKYLSRVSGPGSCAGGCQLGMPVASTCRKMRLRDDGRGRLRGGGRAGLLRPRGGRARLELGPSLGEGRPALGRVSAGGRGGGDERAGFRLWIGYYGVAGWMAGWMTGWRERKVQANIWGYRLVPPIQDGRGGLSMRAGVARERCHFHCPRRDDPNATDIVTRAPRQPAARTQIFLTFPRPATINPRIRRELSHLVLPRTNCWAAHVIP